MGMGPSGSDGEHCASRADSEGLAREFHDVDFVGLLR